MRMPARIVQEVNTARQQDKVHGQMSAVLVSIVLMGPVSVSRTSALSDLRLVIVSGSVTSC